MSTFDILFLTFIIIFVIALVTFLALKLAKSKKRHYLIPLSLLLVGLVGFSSILGGAISFYNRTQDDTSFRNNYLDNSENFKFLDRYYHSNLPIEPFGFYFSPYNVLQAIPLDFFKENGEKYFMDAYFGYYMDTYDYFFEKRSEVFFFETSLEGIYHNHISKLTFTVIPRFVALYKVNNDTIELIEEKDNYYLNDISLYYVSFSDPINSISNNYSSLIETTSNYVSDEEVVIPDKVYNGSFDTNLLKEGVIDSNKTKTILSFNKFKGGAYLKKDQMFEMVLSFIEEGSILNFDFDLGLQVTINKEQQDKTLFNSLQFNEVKELVTFNCVFSYFSFSSGIIL